jgi:hypothetical protein
MPDVPATDVLRIGNKLVVGTDYGVLVRSFGTDGELAGDWTRLGGSSLPLTTVFDLHDGADGFLYAATHGRGIWKLDKSSLGTG